MSNRLSSTMLRTGSKRPNSFTKSQVTFLRSELARILPELPRDGTTTKASVAKRLQQYAASTVKSWTTGTPKPSWEVQQAIRGIKKVTRRNVETLYDGLDVKVTNGRKWQDYFGHGVKLPAKRITPSKLPKFSESDPTTTRDAIINAAKHTEALRNMLSDLAAKVDFITVRIKDIDKPANPVTKEQGDALMRNAEEYLRKMAEIQPNKDKFPPSPSVPTIWFGTQDNMQSFPVNDINTQFTMQVPEGMNARIQNTPIANRPVPRIEIAPRSDSEQFGSTTTETQGEIS